MDKNQCGIKEAQARLERDVNGVISQCPEERHLECALLAWQQLGHSGADSLYKFYETKKIEQERKAIMYTNRINDFLKILDLKPTMKDKEIMKETKHSKATDSTSISSYSMGPVLKLPVQQKIIMRMENSGNVRQTHKKPKADEKNIMNKIDAVCCLDSACVERLSTLDATTSELRLRAAKLAQREAERAELLERAEAAWKNLELGYHRRLTLAEEKEDDISKQIQKLHEERNNYKTVCTTLVQQLKERGEAAEKEREKLTAVEKSVYDRACVRLRLTEQVAKEESALAEQHCRGAQVDRDLQFKEEEARRKLRNMESELESTRALTHDTERAMRGELGALKEQVARVSEQLLAEDAESGTIKQELEEMQQEKLGMVEDLDGCKVMCEDRMQGRMGELKKKKQQLNDLKDKVIECRCKFPIDATVEVKRTASLAALCHCTPEEKILESCSCTSLRSQLLSNLLADLFGGLLAELGWSGSQMPCQLLKCLEDKHNWDRASVLKTNLRSFFARLLVGELDIAIATSIEKYHARWVGATCADIARIIPDTCEAEHSGWQERAMERRAQKLAAKLAEQLFQDRADQLAQKAKEIVASGPPPCECEPQTAVFPCIVKPSQPTSVAGSSKSGKVVPHNWRHAFNDVTQLRLQIESLKKDSIKKADLKTMEEKIAKLVERTSVQENLNDLTSGCYHNALTSPTPINLDYSASKRKSPFIKSPKKGNKKVGSMKLQMDKSAKSFNKLKQTFAVNLCLCRTQTGANKKELQDKPTQDTNLVENDDELSYNQRSSNVAISQVTNIKKTKPINTQLPATETRNEKQGKTSIKTTCKDDCICFHKKPSNTSIDKLLETIAKWKNDLTNSSVNQDKHLKKIQNSVISSEKNMKDKRNSKASNKFEQDVENKINMKDKRISKEGYKFDQDVENRTNMKDKRISKECCKLDQDVENKTSMKDKRNSKASYKFGQDVENKTNMKDKRVSKESCKFNQDIENKSIKSIRKSFSKDNSRLKERQNKDHENFQGLPKTTESEYMGAVNLDKSNESVCKCDSDVRKGNDDACETPHKCISFKKCHCKKSSAKANILPETPLLTESNISGKEGVNDDQASIPTEIGDATNAENKSSELFSCDCEITLIGVTLADNKSRKSKKSHAINSCFSDDDYDSGYDCCNRRNRFNRRKKSRKSGRTSRNNCLDDFTPCCNKPPTCNCQDNFDEMKDFITGTCMNSKDVFMLNVDKGLDVIDTIEGELKTEDCICCNNNDIVETKNLEENTFHLLEEHLKQKLDEFKTTSCKSSCIQPEEEQKLFSTLIHKVKQIIVNSANNVSCKCSIKPLTEGSWNRAYSLLQEYLKAKIQRVECQCTTKGDPSSIESVLDKVCKLIEHDFDRLKSICKCKSADHIPGINAARQILCEEEIPVKDVSTPPENYNFYNEEIQMTCYDSEKVHDIRKNDLKSTIVTENISSQVPLNLGMESKSCNVIEKGSVNIQTSQITKINATNECGSTASKSHYDCCCDIFSKERVPIIDFGKTELLVNHCTKLNQQLEVNLFPKNVVNRKSYSYPGLDPQRCTFTTTEINKSEKVNIETNTSNENLNVDKTTHLPYVGYTVDCSCDTNIGACVCMKSVVEANNDKFLDMWKTYIDYNKTRLKNVSYIMNSISHKPTVITDIVLEETQNVSKTSIQQKSKHEVCEVKLSANGDEDITLKESRDNIEEVHSAACALTESFNMQTNCLIGKDSLDWCECSSRPINISNDDCDKTMCSHVSSHVFDGNVEDDLTMNQLPKNCNCDVVPICHVKMLVESIENKLIQSRCTCDSLVSVVCPIHSSGFM